MLSNAPRLKNPSRVSLSLATRRTPISSSAPPPSLWSFDSTLSTIYTGRRVWRKWLRREHGHLAVASQTRQALKNPGAVPAASGISFDGAVVRVGMFLTVEEDGFAAMVEVYETLVS